MIVLCDYFCLPFFIGVPYRILTNAEHSENGNIIDYIFFCSVDKSLKVGLIETVFSYLLCLL